MSDCSVDTAGVLKKWVNEYLAWMNQSGFAPSTIYIHERLLGHFKRFAEQRRLCLRQLFTQDNLVDFEGHCGLLYASWTLRALARYLAQRGIIACAIERTVVRLPDIYQDYLEFYKQCGRVAPATLKTTRRILTALYEYLTAARVALPALDIEHIDAFLDRHNKGLAMATCRHNRSYLRGFLRYLYHNRGVVGRDLSRLVAGAIDFAHTNPPKFLRPEEIKRLFAAPKTHSPWELRCLAMAHLAHALGLRPKEIGLLTLDDVFFEKKSVRIVHRKNDNPLILPLAETAIKAMAAYLVGVRPKADSRRLFLTLTVPFRPIAAETVSCDITRLVRRVNPQATAYWLRHTYAQTLLSSKASIFEVKEMMGHDSLHATRRYLHVHTSLMRRTLFNETV